MIFKNIKDFFKIYKYIFFIKCEISTPQFLECQDKYYFFNQTGYYSILNKRFYTDHKIKGSHDVWGFISLKDFKKYVIKYL